jgi:hypothetical protein
MTLALSHFVNEAKQATIVDSVAEKSPQPIVINVVEIRDHINFHYVLGPVLHHSFPQAV